MSDLKVLIEQVLSNSFIHPLQVSYNQLPSIVACADYCIYPIDSKIICTFMHECRPFIPWETIEQWKIEYNTPPYKALIESINQFVVDECTWSAEDQKKLLLVCAEKNTWPFETWFVDDTVFEQVFDSFCELKKICTDYSYSRRSYNSIESYCNKEGLCFLWELLCRENFINLWKKEKIVAKIICLVSNKIGDDTCCCGLRMRILKLMIIWGLNNDTRYLNIPKDYQKFDQFIEWYVSDISNSEADSTKTIKELVDIAIASSQSWNGLTNEYTLGALINKTIKWCLGDPVWLIPILKTLNRKNLKTIKLTVMTTLMSGNLEDEGFRQLVKDIYGIKLL